MTTSELSPDESRLGDSGTAVSDRDDPRRRHLRREATWLVATVAVTTLLVVVILQLWRASPRIPFTYASDGNFTSVMVKGIAEEGWYQTNPNIGAPFGYELNDFPVGGENVGIAIIKALTFASQDWALVSNFYWLLTFPLVAGVSYLVLRRLGLGPFASLVTANLFTLLPFHFIPGPANLLQSGYWAVPLGALLVLDVLRQPDERPLVGGRSPRWRWVWSLALGVVIASSGPYYAFFTILLMAVAAGFALLTRATRPNVIRAAVLAGVIVVVGALNNLPSLLYHQRNGTNPLVAARALGEGDIFGLHLSELLLPVADHRVEPLAELSAEAAAISTVTRLPNAPNAPLGIAGVIGLLASVGWCLLLALRAHGGSTLRGPPLLARLGLLNLAGILVATVTGLSTIIGLAGLVQIRVWARMSVFVGFFSLVALGIVGTLVADRARAWLAARGRSDRATLIIGSVAAVLACLAVADQTTPAMIPRYSLIREQVASDREFVQGVENILPPGSAVFQLPIVSFPERPPVVQMYDYEQFRPYLQSHELRWSYGAMRGRPADWSAALGGAPLDPFLDDIVDAGFSGLYVNRDGFTDRGLALETGLVERLGPPDVVSRDGRQAFWDLREWATRRRGDVRPGVLEDRRDEVLHPVEVTAGAGAYPLDVTPPTAGFAETLYYPELPGQSTGRWARSTTTMELESPLHEPRRVAITFDAQSPGRTGTLDVNVGSAHASVPLSGEKVPVRLETVLPPGVTTLRLLSTVPDAPLPDGRPASFRMTEFRVDDLD